MTDTIVSYRGKLVEEMTREELIEAVRTLGRQYTDLNDSFRSYLDFQSEIRRLAA